MPVHIRSPVFPEFQPVIAIEAIAAHTGPGTGKKFPRVAAIIFPGEWDSFARSAIQPQCGNAHQRY